MDAKKWTPDEIDELLEKMSKVKCNSSTQKEILQRAIKNVKKIKENRKKTLK